MNAIVTNLIRKKKHLVHNYCSLYPYHVIKVVRLRLRFMEDIMALETNKRFRTLLLIRDPRATMHSRLSLTWCQKSAECNDVQKLCDDMVADYDALLALQRKYPDRVR